MKKTLMISACVAAGLALAACGNHDKAPAATDAAADASATTNMSTDAAMPANGGSMASANGAAPAASDSMSPGAAPAGSMSPAPATGTGARAPSGNQQVQNGVVNSSDPVPPAPGDYSSNNPRPN